jgi:hypothetical protein
LIWRVRDGLGVMHKEELTMLLPGDGLLEERMN